GSHPFDPRSQHDQHAASRTLRHPVTRWARWWTCAGQGASLQAASTIMGTQNKDDMGKQQDKPQQGRQQQQQQQQPDQKKPGKQPDPQQGSKQQR
ncbi:hypothetical protein, partial [Stenotrophomonas chelatiphaga]|uniref:hypothetical protein n=1 Tax=Stenotrophomonas chelatiphaga TaxID=517011 RepID=UPI001B804D71